MIQNAAAHLVFDWPKKTHVTPLLVTLTGSLELLEIHLNLSLSVTATGSTPAYLNAMIQLHSSFQPLLSSNEHMLSFLPSLSSKRSQSRLFSIMVPQWWSDLHGAVHSSDSLGTKTKTYHINIFIVYGIIIISVVVVVVVNNNNDNNNILL